MRDGGAGAEPDGHPIVDQLGRLQSGEPLLVLDLHSLRLSPSAAAFTIEGMEQAVASRAAIETLSVNTIRTLSIDAIQKANSGHPGTPMALAPLPTPSGSASCASTRRT